ncbi:MAG: hypothetical protein AAGA73_13950 [Pseudomonadota bacterium]
MDTWDDKREIDEFGWWPQISSAGTVALFDLVPDHLHPRQL